jgi:hypothetical protein
VAYFFGYSMPVIVMSYWYRHGPKEAEAES